ncbi:hypothetical protein [Agromyces ramosus]|nr:hypothetical protein [Agromyces ramosus]
MATNQSRTRRTFHRTGGTLRWAERPGGRDQKFDTVLVLVHGMGAAFRSEILLEWSEPLLQRMDWLARDRVIGGNSSHGVTIHNSDLVGDPPMITATVKFPGPEPEVPYAPTTIEHSVAVLEARWSESFVPMKRAQVFQWAIAFLWRAIIRMLAQFWGTMVLVPWYTLTNHPRSIWRNWRQLGFLRFLAIPGVVVIDLVRLILAFTAYVVVSAFVFALGIVASAILPLVSPLLLIPAFKKAAQDVIDGIVESIGDVAAWKERPVRAMAMRLVVRSALERARELVRDTGEVHVFAHSQGAAVATFALFEELTPSDYQVKRLTTVGAAVTLLGRDKWRGRPDVYTPVSDWLRVTKDAPVEWANHWAIWDPFSSGPIADTNLGARARWRNAYFPVPDDSEGPEEHAVHNTSQPFTDHSVYYKNIVQVVDPTARSVLGSRFPSPKPTVDYVDNRLSVVDKKSNGANMLASLPIAAILPGLPLTASWLIWVYSGIAWLVGWILGLIPGSKVTPESAQSAIGFLVSGDPKMPLSAWGWVISSLLLLAVLIWINQMVSWLSLRSRVWKRCPRSPKLWLLLWSIPRVFFVAGGAVALCVAVVHWGAPLGGDVVTWLCILIVATAVFVFIEPLIAPVPMIVPARGPAGPAAEAPAARRLLAVIAEDEFQDDLRLRREGHKAEREELQRLADERKKVRRDAAAARKDTLRSSRPSAAAKASAT